ncbi:hypothetical protein PM023_17145 [Halorubrum ezzemoulense]|jgi:hypothetical protein|uniref:hypothetical protein n=1 Tax=Halorubrum ezzemoulense TaxID=337243 RepID=UPI00232BBAC6|nr:hypothetical protein [Halorubrum ezzemoulense]MDB2226363.1 hypothetical protein [Halorubrum ezzemoulense]
MSNSMSDLALELFDPADHPDGTAEVLGAVWYLRNADRRSRRGAIRERVGDDMTRDQIRYRLDSLADAGLLTVNTYEDHNQIVNEYLFTDVAATHDGETCYRGCRILDDDELADPSPGTMIALAGRVSTVEDRLDEIEDELDLGDDDDDRAALHDFINN